MEQYPCPDRIVFDFGSAFVMGSIGGAAVQSIKGAYNSPKGHRFSGAIQNCTLRAPTIGGNFAVWGGLFSTFDCILSHVRDKHDPWNAVLAGGLTGGVLAIRSGPKGAAKAFMIGALLLGFIESAAIPLGEFAEKAFGGPGAQKMPEAARKTMLSTDVTQTHIEHLPPPAFTKILSVTDYSNPDQPVVVEEIKTPTFLESVSDRFGFTTLKSKIGL